VRRPYQWLQLDNRQVYRHDALRPVYERTPREAVVIDGLWALRVSNDHSGRSGSPKALYFTAGRMASKTVCSVHSGRTVYTAPAISNSRAVTTASANTRAMDRGAPLAVKVLTGAICGQTLVRPIDPLLSIVIRR
jgi:hypothetical protein